MLLNPAGSLENPLLSTAAVQLVYVGISIVIWPLLTGGGRSPLHIFTEESLLLMIVPDYFESISTSRKNIWCYIKCWFVSLVFWIHSGLKHEFISIICTFLKPYPVTYCSIIHKLGRSFGKQQCREVKTKYVELAIGCNIWPLSPQQHLITSPHLFRGEPWLNRTPPVPRGRCPQLGRACTRC